MWGCFNIALYSYFDIHRIFDLVSYRLWDFIIWWFDIDFVLYDFNFDFILCLSYLFLFLIHFFLKLIFSFLYNFIQIHINFKNIMIIVYFTQYILIYFLSYLLIIGVHNLLLYIELIRRIDNLIFNDFISFTYNNNIIVNSNTQFRSIKLINFNFILFYFVIQIIYYLFMLIIRFFFSCGYTYCIFTDIIYNFIYIYRINVEGLIHLFLIESGYVFLQFESLQFNLSILNINTLFLFSMVIIFYMYSIFYLENVFKGKSWLFIKHVKYLFNLDSCFSLIFSKTLFSNVNFTYLYVYIIFLINFSNNLIKDFNTLIFSTETYNILYMFIRYQQNTSVNNINYYKKQLQYIIFF